LFIVLFFEPYLLFTQALQCKPVQALCVIVESPKRLGVTSVVSQASEVPVLQPLDCALLPSKTLVARRLYGHPKIHAESPDCTHPDNNGPLDTEVGKTSCLNRDLTKRSLPEPIPASFCSAHALTAATWFTHRKAGIAKTGLDLRETCRHRCPGRTPGTQIGARTLAANVITISKCGQYAPMDFHDIIGMYLDAAPLLPWKQYSLCIQNMPA